jgi:hypothetical protein
VAHKADSAPFKDLPPIVVRLEQGAVVDEMSAGNSPSNIDITAILKHTSDQTQGDPLRLRSPFLRLRSSAQDQIDQALLLVLGVERFLQRLVAHAHRLAGALL